MPSPLCCQRCSHNLGGRHWKGLGFDASADAKPSAHQVYSVRLLHRNFVLERACALTDMLRPHSGSQPRSPVLLRCSFACPSPRWLSHSSFAPTAPVAFLPMGGLHRWLESTFRPEWRHTDSSSPMGLELRGGVGIQKSTPISPGAIWPCSALHLRTCCL